MMTPTWKQATITLAIRASDGTVMSRTVRAHVYGHLAVHRPISGGYQSHSWQISHIPTGRRLLDEDRCIVTLSDAKRLVAIMTEQIDWSPTEKEALRNQPGFNAVIETLLIAKEYSIGHKRAERWRKKWCRVK